MMRYKVLLFFLLVLWVAQTAKSQDVALKTNTLMWATTTPNLGLEVALSPRYTLELSGFYNPWTFKDDKKMRFWLVQPELKYWFCEKSEGHFVGMHLHGAQYFGGFKKKRYDAIWPEEVSLTGTTGFSRRIGTWRPPSVSAMPACGMRRAPASIARSAEKTNIRTISGLPKLPCH
mgnify:CR=1 FL=1